MIKYIEGNLFDSKANILCHQCNCQGVMGSGIALEVKKRYPNVFLSYFEDFKENKLKLGYVNFTRAKGTQIIASMCGQDKYGYKGLYTNYDKLQDCLNSVKQFALTNYKEKPIIAFPYKMSCDRAGGDWNVVSKMIEDTFKDFDVEIWKLK